MCVFNLPAWNQVLLIPSSEGAMVLRETVELESGGVLSKQRKLSYPSTQYGGDYVNTERNMQQVPTQALFKKYIRIHIFILANIFGCCLLGMRQFLSACIFAVFPLKYIDWSTNKRHSLKERCVWQQVPVGGNSYALYWGICTYHGLCGVDPYEERHFWPIRQTIIQWWIVLRWCFGF